jgi:hypothetical protein
VFHLFINQVKFIYNTSSHRVDYRDRRDRLTTQTEHWELQIDLLVEGYLEHRASDGGDGMPGGIARPLSDQPVQPPFTVQAIDTYCK